MARGPRILLLGWLFLSLVACSGGSSRARAGSAKCIPRPLGHPDCGSQCPATFPGEGTSCSPLYGDCRYTNDLTCACEGTTASSLHWVCKPTP